MEVLDNLMGIGNTGVSAIKLGRKFIGIENNEKKYDTARSRISGINVIT